MSLCLPAGTAESGCDAIAKEYHDSGVPDCVGLFLAFLHTQQVTSEGREVALKSKQDIVYTARNR